MIRISIDDAGSLSVKEATALGHMFMHLAGHSLHAEPVAVPLDIATVTGTMPIPEIKRDWDKSPPAWKNAAEPDFLSGYPAPPSPAWAGVDMAEPGTDRSVVLAPDNWDSQSDIQITGQDDISESESELVTTVANGECLLDSKGNQWDERIHAKNKSKTANGAWKLGRNVDPKLVKAILLGNPVPPVPVPVPPPVPMPPVPVPVPPPVPMPPMPASYAPPPLPPVPTASVLPAPLPPVPVAASAYESVLKRIQSALTSKRVAIPTVNNIIRSFKDGAGNTIVDNLASLGLLPEATKQDISARINAELDRVMA